jgi:signal peptidase II
MSDNWRRNMEFIIAIIIIILDRITKYAAKGFWFPDKSMDIIRNYLSFTYLENRGAAFGIFKNKKFLLVGVTTLVVIFLIYYLYKNRSMSRLLKIGLTLIIAGAIGNLIDRVAFSYVVDFIYFHVKDIFDWPVFNFADISVVCGSIILALCLLLGKE